ncbi:MAG: hypothetical protein DDT30_01121 [Dehalococcoidia bacterium]|nr:hypothetical protein [Bacillota bacterium]MBT9163698.1 hypothetical protein [Chloroflexota bacterium]
MNPGTKAKTIGMILLAVLLVAVPVGYVFAEIPGNPSTGSGFLPQPPSPPTPPCDTAGIMIVDEDGNVIRWYPAEELGGVPPPAPSPPCETAAVMAVGEDGNLERWESLESPYVGDLLELLRRYNIRSLADFEKVFSPNPRGEHIVHEIPPNPIIVDGVWYKPQEISRFDGEVLRLVFHEPGVIHAFTTPEGLQEFLEREWGWRFPQWWQEDESKSLNPTASSPFSGFFEHWRYEGRQLWVQHPGYIVDLGVYTFDNISSSATIASATNGVSLWDGPGFTGQKIWLAPGTNHWFLWGWNDRASSLAAWPYP